MTYPNAPVQRRAFFGIILLALMSGSAVGQNRSLLELYRGSSPTLSRSTISQMSEEARRLGETSQVNGLQVPLEGAVNELEYLVGPNDQFTITIGGLEPNVVPSIVSSDGVLLLPGIGRVEAAGRTLAEVRASALEKLRNSFRNVEVEVALTRPRQFYVHVTGAVPEPGRYLAMPVARVEDVLKQAFFSRTLEPPTSNPGYRPALRNIVVSHSDGSVATVDLVKYYRMGQTAWNPYLQDGDAIQVPSFDPNTDAVFIDGEVPFPGVYDYRPGDTVLDLVRVGTGNEVISERLVVQHTTVGDDGQASSTSYSMADLESGPERPVRPLDHINFPRVNPLHGLASIEGWVRFPGRYPIVVGRTTLPELVKMAGGVKEGALLRAAYLERDADLVPKHRDALEELQYFELRQAAQLGAGRWEILTDSSSALWNMRLGDLGYMSRYYLARWLRMDNRVSVDIAAELRTDSSRVYLENGDRLVIPKDENAVFVIGEVVRPGRVTFSPGLRSGDYVARAGGQGPMASSTYVIRAGVGQIVPGAEPVYSGDYVFVDRSGGEPSNTDAERLRLQLEDQSLRKFQTVLQTVGTVLGIVTTALLVENALNN